MKVLNLVLVLLSIFSLLIYLIIALSFYISITGSLVVWTVLLYLALQKILKIIIFPGSTSWYLNSIETFHCIELCEKLKICLSQLKNNLNEIDLKMSHFQLKYYTEPVKEIERVRIILDYLVAQKQANKSQKHLIDLLKSVQSSIQRLFIGIENGLSEQLCLEEESLLLEIKKNIKKCNKFLSHFIARSRVHYLYLFFSSKPLGSIDYMRATLITLLDAEQVWVQTPSSKIDSLFIKNDSDRTILFCNANAGLYEYSFSQAEWMQFYYDQGVNIILWNYRGYGRSSGSPDLKLIQEDGFFLMDYYKEKYSLNRVAVHGQSLGGSVACYLAKKHSPSFLFADRCFSSLSEVAFFRFGKICYWAIRLFCSDSNTVSDFLGAKCYKVISADFNDEMIPDLASLKSGVALKFFYPNFSVVQVGYLQPEVLQKMNHILTSRELSQLIDDIKLLYIHKSKFEGLLDLFNELDEIKAGGKSLKDALNKDFEVLAAALWVYCLDIWGSTASGNEKLACYMVVVEKLRSVIEGIESNLIRWCQIEKKFAGVKNAAEKIMRALEEKCGIHDELDDFLLANRNVDVGISGKLLSLSSGHCGQYSFSERNAYLKHFQVFLGE